jgi:alkanesulfonate monooxygenase SsuD/methylene tetrahydromethanopterin reductase-like flavin-dependent oxidoreductase (luciferase family)
LPARVTLQTFAKRVEYLRGLCRDAGRPMIEAAVMPLTSVGKDRAAALSGIDLNTIIAESQRFTSWMRESPQSDDPSRGLTLAGAPADIVRECRAYAAAGADQIVFDLRLRFDAWYEQLERLGEEVLPVLRASPAAED